ncbi:MAG: hypothetical protein AAGF86_06750, partial [Pseudomonadota bacterium]
LEEECDSALFITDGKLYYFPEIREGIQSYKDVLAGNAPPSLDDHLVSKRQKAARSGKSWFGSLASVNFKAQLFGRKAKSHVLKRKPARAPEPSVPLRIPPPKPSMTEVSKPPEAPPQLVRSPQVEEKPKLDRFAHSTDILERMLEVRK